ncbi:ATP-grasp domain-containing protein [Palleronia sp.]|uniref:ATP-grasp domain-containing protein n=1 Tax=Palleronia sp. TaxID=1940284 RepID=UPI0035C823E7
MAVLFRPCGDLFAAPAPRCARDRALHAYLTERLGRAVTHQPGSDVDYEDWTEPACMLEAALRSGLEVKILPRQPLTKAINAPDIVIEGRPCRDMLIGRSLASDPRNADWLNLGWPSACNDLANHYAETEAFHAFAGRRMVLADMPGETARLRSSSHLSRTGSNGDLEEAIRGFAGQRCFVKVVWPAKTEAPFKLDVPAGCSRGTAKGLFLDATGYLSAAREGDRDAILVQEHVEMRHETRFFVINGQIVTGTGCIERDTPAQNPEGLTFSGRSEVRRNDGRVGIYPAQASVLQAHAEGFVAALAEEAPELAHYAVDCALKADGTPVVIELNPIAESGLYAASHMQLFAAIVAAAELEPERHADYAVSEHVARLGTTTVADEEMDIDAFAFD